MNIETFKKICKVKDQMKLKEVLKQMLRKYYPEVIDENGFLYVRSQGVDVMLTAHMDTVHKEKCKKIVEIKQDGQKILWSPQGIGGDDRCGIFMITELLKTTSFRPAIVFCEDEEIGCIGAGKFAKWLAKNADTKELELKYIIELDRRNGNDAVFYDCGNEEFIKYICDTTGYKEATGSYSDICEISPALDVASVNLSCGYYKEHTLEHYVIVEEMERTFLAVQTLLAAADTVEKFDYKEIKYWSNYYNYNYNYGYGSANRWTEEFLVVAMKNGNTIMSCYEGTFEECIGQFLMEHDDITYSEVIYTGDPYEYEEMIDETVNIVVD